MMKFALLASVAPLAFMSDAVPVVVIVTDNGPVRINASDYDPAKHTLHEGEEAPAAAVKPAATVQPADKPADKPASGQLMVMKDGKKFAVVDAAGNKIERDGIDAKGYATEQDAWNAILALPAQ